MTREVLKLVVHLLAFLCMCTDFFFHQRNRRIHYWMHEVV